MKQCVSKFRSRRGSALILALVLSIIIAALVMTLAWSAGVQTQATANLKKVDTAFINADAGVQHAAWFIKNNIDVTQPLTKDLNGGSYSVTWTDVGNDYRVTSVGTVGPAQTTVIVTVTPPSGAPQTAISIARNLTIKNLVINGNVAVGESITFMPGVAQINGDLQYGTAVNGGNNVSGNATKAPWLGVDWQNLDTTLRAAAGKSYASPQSNRTFNFDALSGQKVIYVDGDVINPDFVGAGTLYVRGKVTLSDDVGNRNAPVNIVATDDIVTDKNITYYGALYTKSDWFRGKIDLYGSVYAEGTIAQTGSGNSSVNFTATPWFDNRSASGGAAAPMRLSNYAGVCP